MSVQAPARIHILRQGVADRIAAGEVVERPASVVKELVENALDAGAATIAVDVEASGAALLRVSDDGSGIHPDDLRLAVQRFATSKVVEADDLTAIRTLGFRGEALPSIAAVSHLEVTTAVRGQAEGRRIRLRGGEVQDEQIVGTPPGTVVTVRQLFFNITLPWLREAHVIVFSLAVINSFKTFDLIYTMTYGGPGRSTQVLGTWMYFNAFQYYHAGYGAAIAWVIAAITLVVAIPYIRHMSRD